MDATAAAAAAAPSAASEEAKAKEAAAAAAARAFLERMTVRKPRRQSVSGSGMFLPGPSRLGATATDE
jgi:phosphodiesterase/alkaline phosphatase D-like protein